MESISWAKERKTFGKQLIKHQVIRHKIANMSKKLLEAQSFLERVAYQMMNDPYGERDKSIARNVALLKVQCTETCQYCAIDASKMYVLYFQNINITILYISIKIWWKIICCRWKRWQN